MIQIYTAGKFNTMEELIEAARPYNGDTRQWIVGTIPEFDVNQYPFIDTSDMPRFQFNQEAISYKLLKSIKVNYMVWAYRL